MRTVIGTLCLNEMEWLPKLYAQHRNWPGLVRWVFVEAADVGYAAANPQLVKDGLSIDGTTQFLEELAAKDDRVLHIQHGLTSHRAADQGKCAARQRYLDAAESIEPDFLIVLDADEFYSTNNQVRTLDWCSRNPVRNCTGFCFRHRELWKPPSYDGPRLEVQGGFWSIPYCRFWRWRSGLQYSSNHNTPEVGGKLLDEKLARFDKLAGSPYMVHTAFTSELLNRHAKHRYYVHRGEGQTDHRQWYVDSRAAWETWVPGVQLPKDAKVVPFTGELPEVLQ